VRGRASIGALIDQLGAAGLLIDNAGLDYDTD
jgi:hypothetical protein